MAKGRNEKIIVGLDIGSHKICTVVGELVDSTLEIIGVGVAGSKGIKKGVVINIDEAVESIRRSVHEAEIMSGFKIKSAYVGIAGGHIKSYNSDGVIAIKSRVVSETDKSRVLEAAAALNIPLDSEVLHILPQEYRVDSQEGIREPVGMSGIRLEVKVHIVTGAVAAVQNIIKCCTNAGLGVNDIIVEQLAAGEAVLSEDEKELGVALVDLGGGTTDIVIFHNGSIKHTSVLTMGGNQVTNDIAIGLRIPTMEAEKLKIKYGAFDERGECGDEKIEMPSLGDWESKFESRAALENIVKERAQEIFELVDSDLEKSNMKKYLCGVVLTGGGALLQGAPRLGKSVFSLPVRIGVPKLPGVIDLINSPQLSTAVGLVIHGSKNHYRTGQSSRANDERWSFGNTLSRMKSFLKEFFE